MKKWDKLKNPPIKEAAFDIRYEVKDKVEIAKLKEFCDGLHENYSELASSYSVGVDVSSIPNKIESTARKDGFRLLNKNGRFVLLIKEDSFTVILLKPYSSFEDLKNELDTYFNQFRDFFGDVVITRIGLRYVNEICFKLELDATIDDYIKIHPVFPSNPFSGIVGYSVRLLSNSKDDEFRSIIRVNFDPKRESDDEYRIIFDIDAFKIGEINNLDDVAQKLDDYKNKIFFSSIGEKSKSLFN